MLPAERADSRIVPRVGVEAVLDHGRFDADLGRVVKGLQGAFGTVGDAHIANVVRHVRLYGCPGFDGVLQGGQG